MKKIILFLAFLFTAGLAGAQSLESLFDKYTDDERFDFVNTNSRVGSMFRGDLLSLSDEQKELMAGMQSEGMRILTLKGSENANLINAFSNELKSLVKAGKFETSTRVRQNGSAVNVYYNIMDSFADILVINQTESAISAIWFPHKVKK